MENTSGMGAQAQVPAEIRGWNWGAFLFNWVWGLFNNTFIALLTLVPCLGWVMVFVLGAKGNEWAWRNKRWESVERFKQVQRYWAWAGLGLLLAWILFAILMVFVVFATMKQSDAYKMSLQMLREEPRVAALIGSPVEEAGLVVTGSVNSQGNGNGQAEISYSVKGPQGEARVFFKAQKVLGQWEIQRFTVQKKENGERIELAQPAGSRAPAEPSEAGSEEDRD